jgi:threonylcarbamoyladenosine tRNA methylthiotransferase MtaB
MRASFYTFGCKLNQYETEALAAAFRDQGFSVGAAGEEQPAEPGAARPEADVYIINTCTVTSKSEQKARRLIRSLSRRHPGALLLVTGCYAQLNGEEIALLGGNVLVVPHDDKDLLLDLPPLLKTAGPGECADAVRSLLRQPHRIDRFSFQVCDFSFHSRAFLKIQDGCDNRCAYCRVPLARGKSVSASPEILLQRLEECKRAGYTELVLTGVNVSAYRHGETGLTELLRGMLERIRGLRLRVSSLEPEMIDEELAEVLADPRICAHFHLPVQSGSDRVLAGMRRRYPASQVERAVALLRRAKPEAFLAADVIVGFPGEDNNDYLQTRSLVERLRFSRLHVFPFSPRPGTAAADMGGRVPERIRDERARELRAVSDRLYRAYAESWVGREVELVLEKEQSGGWRGVSGNYLKVLLTAAAESRLPAGLRAGSLVRVRIEEPGDICRGVFLERL